MVQYIETRRPQGSANNEVTIIFDGRSEYLDQQYSSHIKVLFSRDEPADDLIKRKVVRADNKKRIVVVTNDKDIRCAVRALGAKVLSVKEFLASSQEEKRKVRKIKKEAMDPGPAKIISKQTEYKINQELADIWIKKKRNPDQ